MIDARHISECEQRKLHVERALAIVTTAAQAPNSAFMAALDQFISGELSLTELEENVDKQQYLNAT